MGCYPAIKTKCPAGLAHASAIKSLVSVFLMGYYPAMLLATSNQSKQLLHVSFIGTLRPADFQSSREDVATLLAGLAPGFHYLVDLTHLEFMGLDCMTDLGRLMDLIGQAGVGLVVRVVPDPGKDIGMNILTAFHYPHHLRIVTCQNLTEAVQSLGL